MDKLTFETTIKGNYSMVYVAQCRLREPLIGGKIVVSSWDDKTLGYGTIVSLWRAVNGDQLVYVKYIIDNKVYGGKCNWDTNKFVRGKQIDTVKEIERMFYKTAA